MAVGFPHIRDPREGKAGATISFRSRPDSANKNIGHPGTFDFSTNNFVFFLSINISPVISGIYLYLHKNL